VCPSNDPEMLDTDFLNWVRAPRYSNMLECWAIPTAQGDRFGDLPRLDGSDAEIMELVREWSDRLRNHAGGLRIGCGASEVLTLNKA